MHQEGKVKGQGRKERENSSQMRTSNIQNCFKCNPGKPNNQIGNMPRSCHWSKWSVISSCKPQTHRSSRIVW
jgi:hypothetical protein